jgi:hypothetical protein
MPHFRRRFPRNNGLVRAPDWVWRLGRLGRDAVLVAHSRNQCIAGADRISNRNPGDNGADRHVDGNRDSATNINHDRATDVNANGSSNRDGDRNGNCNADPVTVGSAYRFTNRGSHQNADECSNRRANEHADKSADSGTYRDTHRHADRTARQWREHRAGALGR